MLLTLHSRFRATPKAAKSRRAPEQNVKIFPARHAQNVIWVFPGVFSFPLRFLLSVLKVPITCTTSTLTNNRAESLKNGFLLFRLVAFIVHASMFCPRFSQKQSAKRPVKNTGECFTIKNSGTFEEKKISPVKVTYVNFAPSHSITGVIFISIRLGKIVQKPIWNVWDCKKRMYRDTSKIKSSTQVQWEALKKLVDVQRCIS